MIEVCEEEGELDHRELGDCHMRNLMNVWPFRLKVCVVFENGLKDGSKI